MDRGPFPWSYMFTVGDLASGILDDGMAQLRVVQTSEFIVRLGQLNLAGRVHVPEPGTLAILGIGLVGLGFARRKRMI